MPEGQVILSLWLRRGQRDKRTSGIDKNKGGHITAIFCDAIQDVLGGLFSALPGFLQPPRQSPAETVTIKNLAIHPIKGCAGVEVTSARVTPQGFEGDRE